MSAEVRFRLKAPQFKVFKSKARFRILIAGRRFGKTHLASTELMVNGVNNSGSINRYIAPTYRMAEEITWDKLKGLIPRGYVAKKDETDLGINLRNQASIALRGADKPDSLRGPGLDFVVLDEASYTTPKAWFEVIRPALSDRKGRALFITTPRGYDWVYDLVLASEGRNDWEAFQFTTAEGGNVDAEEIEAARSELDERTFRQEYMASFEAMTGRVYYAFDRKENGRPLQDNVNAPLLVGMDFNVDPMTAAIAIRAGDQIHFIDEVVLRDGNTDLMAKALKKRYPNRKISVFPDPTGNARKTSADVGQTDFTILRQHGFTVLAPSSPYPVADKINTVNAAFCNAKGVRRAFIDPVKCPHLARGFDGLTFREGTSEPDKSSGHDHITDAAAYLLLWELPIRAAVRRVEVVMA